jgi:DNA repair exonuclease SbcCD ATPase subunit
LRPVSDSVKKKILELWLGGTTYRQISAMTGASTGAISKIIGEYRQKTPDLEELRKLHLELREAKITLLDALRGARFLRSLDELEFDSKRLIECLKFIKRGGEHAGELASAGIRLIELEKKAGKPYEQILQESDEKLKAEAESSERVKTFEDRELKLRASIRHLEKLSMLQETIDRHNITPAVLESLIGDELRLQALGFTSQQAEVLAQELTRRQLDPAMASAQIASLLRDRLDLEEAKKKSEEEAKKWACELEKARTTTILLKEEIERSQHKLSKLEEDYKDRDELLEKKHEALESKLKAEYDAEKQRLEADLSTRKQEIESQIRDLRSQAATLRTEVQDLESAKASSGEAEAALKKIQESVENSRILGVIVSLIKDPTALKSRSEVIEAVHAILAGFKTYLEASSFTSWKNKSYLKTAVDRLVEESR